MDARRACHSGERKRFQEPFSSPGQGLDAVGSYDGSRARGLRVLQFTPIQIQGRCRRR